MLEALESRQLLSASLTSTGTLVVGGTGESDTINVRREATKIYGKVNATVTSFNAESVLRIHVEGGSGNDRIGLHEITRPATLNGGGGNDHLLGSAGHEVFNGGDGNDLMDGRLGADVFNGGGGFDVVSYESRTTGVVVSLDGESNDGAPPTSAHPGERDNVKRDVEGLVGSQGNDRIYGNELANHLNGARGNDTVYGGAGNDTLTGGYGEDLLYGQAGNDTFFAKDGARDRLLGGEGEDRANKDDIDHAESIEALFS
jgi:Ca2+-binding RTX toxin-like protein